MTDVARDRPVTVGVDDGQRAALAFAAEQAQALGCDLRVAHAFTVPPGPPDAVSAMYGIDVAGSFREAGRAVVIDAAAFLATVHGDVVVHQVLRQGRPGPVLTTLAETSRLVVLGPDDDTPWYSRLFQSRVSRALVESSACPVVVVPDTWSTSSRRRGVTLLLDARTVAHGPLRFAFDHASRQHEMLHVVHVDVDEGDGVPWHDMSRLVDSWGSRYTEVWTDVRRVRRAADLETIESLENTGLLVLGRTHHRQGMSMLHRSLARAVIEHADCPVAVVPPHHDG